MWFGMWHSCLLRVGSDTTFLMNWGGAYDVWTTALFFLFHLLSGMCVGEILVGVPALMR